jgi:hypothetical protein
MSAAMPRRRPVLSAGDGPVVVPPAGALLVLAHS